MNNSTVTFDELWKAIQTWGGWLREDQALALWKAAKEVKEEGVVVEIGSYHGKSASVLLLGTRDSNDIFAIEPHGGTDRSPGEWIETKDIGEEDHEVFLSNLGLIAHQFLDGELPGRFTHVRKFSDQAHDSVLGEIALLYIDGAHRYGDVSNDINGWGSKVAHGGQLFIHDVFNSAGVTLAVFRMIVTSRHWRLVSRSHSLYQFERTDVDKRKVLIASTRFLTRCPILLRAVLVRKFQTSRFGNLSYVANIKKGY